MAYRDSALCYIKFSDLPLVSVPSFYRVIVKANQGQQVTTWDRYNERKFERYRATLDNLC